MTFDDDNDDQNDEIYRVNYFNLVWRCS